MFIIFTKLFCVCILQSDVISKVGARHAIVDTIKVLLDRAYPALTDTAFITQLVKKVRNWILVLTVVAVVYVLQVSEQFTAVDMDLSEDSVDLEEAAVNGIQLLNVSMYIHNIAIYLCFPLCAIVYVCKSIANVVPYSGKVWLGECLANLLFSNVRWVGE